MHGSSDFWNFLANEMQHNYGFGHDSYKFFQLINFTII